MEFTLTVSSLLDSWIMSRMNHSWMNEPRYCVELVSIPSSPHQNLQMLPWIEIVTSSEEHLGDILDSCPLQYLVKLMNITLWNNLKKIKQLLLFFFFKSNLHLLFIFHQTATEFPPQTEPTPTHNRSSLPIECEVIVWEVYKHTNLKEDAAINPRQHEYSSTDGQTFFPPWHCNLVFDWN